MERVLTPPESHYKYNEIKNRLEQSIMASKFTPTPFRLTIPVTSGHRVLKSASVGYTAPTFQGKQHQLMEVKGKIRRAGWIPEPIIEEQVNWFYNSLGIDDVYFEVENSDAIATNITSIYAAKVAAYCRGDRREEIPIDVEAHDHAIYIDTNDPGEIKSGAQYESQLEAKYLDRTDTDKRFRVESFRSPAPLDQPESSNASLTCYFVYQCQFIGVRPDSSETRLEVISDRMFLVKATKNTMQIYQDVLELAIARIGPVIEFFDFEDSDEKRLVVAFRCGTAKGLFSALANLCHSHGVMSTRKYVEQFSNGITVMSMYLRPASNRGGHLPLEKAIHHITNEISLLYCVPHNKLDGLFDCGALSLQEAIYGHCAWLFIYHFLSRFGLHYASLFEKLGPKNFSYADVLSKSRLSTQTLSSDYILKIISQYPPLVQALYATFASNHLKAGQDAGSESITRVLSVAELHERITRCVSNQHEKMVMEAFLIFNRSILKTNYFAGTKIALSFRLDPSFLPEIAYPRPLFGIFLVIGSEFRGLHVRFRDIARGEILIKTSQNEEIYDINARNMFDEIYGLASIRQQKDKNIAEGGSMGILLLDHQQPEKSQVAFEKYIDAILDLLITPKDTRNTIIDRYGKEEMIFMDPSESIINYVDWAVEHAHARGSRWWNSLFADKSARLGGMEFNSNMISSDNPAISDLASSSLEVLAGLCFDDEGFVEHMCCGGSGETSEFYRAYIQEIRVRIQETAKLENEAIEREHKVTGILYDELRDRFSVAITTLDEELQELDIWKDDRVSKGVLSNVMPGVLLDKIGAEVIVKRLPGSYLRGMVGAYLASRFVYEFGTSPSQLAFQRFMGERVYSFQDAICHTEHD